MNRSNLDASPSASVAKLAALDVRRYFGFEKLSRYKSSISMAFVWLSVVAVVPGKITAQIYTTKVSYTFSFADTFTTSPKLD